MVLDVMLPGLNGFEVLRRLRDKSKIPVLLLTARGEDVDRIVGLEIGADDYLPKPFNPRELVARIRAILRRTRTPERVGSGQPSEMLRVGEVELDPGTRTVLQKGKPVELTSVEFNLLHVLLREAGRVVPRERLVDIVLSRKFSPFDRSIDMHVSKIRKKLGDSDSGVDHIKTVRGVGYIFTRPQEAVRAARRSGSGAALMKSLFLKIFLSYWVAQALFLVLAILITLAVREHGESATWDAQQATVFTKAVQTYEQAARRSAALPRRSSRLAAYVRAYLLDEQGKEVSGRDLPRWAESLGKGVEPPRRDFWQRLTPSPFRRQV